MNKVDRLIELLGCGYKALEIKTFVPGDPNAISPLEVKLSKDGESVTLRFDKKEEIIRAEFILNN